MDTHEPTKPTGCGQLLDFVTETGPVRRISGADGDVERWLVTRYADVRAALANPRLSSTRAYTDDLMDPAHDAGSLEHSMIAVDPPDHTRLRKLAVRAFSAAKIEALRPRVQQLTDELLDAAVNDAADGVVDVVAALAFPLPVRVISEILGVPEDVRERLLANGDSSGMVPMDVVSEAMTELIQARRGRPSDDLLGDLVTAHEAGRLSDAELTSMAVMLFAAGHVTTVHLIRTGVVTLLDHPDQVADIRREPSLLAAAVDELLRHAGPVPAVARYALDDTEVGGVTIPRGSHVTVALTTANHDHDEFANPDAFDVHRDGGVDVAFGHGIHFCLGARLAKLETEVALGTLLRRFPHLDLPPHDQDPTTAGTALPPLPTRLTLPPG